ncbi:MAG: superfamily I DNA and/or RNA helicase [Psychromonas sp.]|jgi:superfamily I DNA and/or RNA helicase
MRIIGSLNQKEGNNWGNVFITRAREKIKVVCSLWPEQLQVDHATDRGQKLLKAYLTYAQNVSDGTFQAN